MKSFYKKPIFWIPIILLALLATPTAIKVFDLYIYHPKTEPNPDDFYIREEDPPFTGFESLPKEDVEIKYSEDGKKVYVYNYKDGYKLELPSKLTIQTRTIEPSRLLIYNKLSNDKLCRYTIVLLNNTKNLSIPKWYKNDKKTEEEIQTLDIVNYSIEKIISKKFTAYYKILESMQFGIEKSILIKGINGIYSISTSGGGEECQPLIKTIFNSFSLE